MQKNNKKFYIVLVLILGLVFTTNALASLTFTNDSIIGEILILRGGLQVADEATFSNTIFPDANIVNNPSIQPSPVAQGNAGTALIINAGDGGAAEEDADGQSGGILQLKGGQGSRKDTGGTNDGSGGDLVLSGGNIGGPNGTAAWGIVRVGNPTVSSTKETDTLAVAGEFEVDGAARFDSAILAQGNAGISNTATVGNAAGTGTCTLIFTSGLLTGGSCVEILE